MSASYPSATPKPPVMSPITIVLLVVIVFLIGVLGYMYFFGMPAEPVYDSSNCAEFVTPECMYDSSNCASVTSNSQTCHNNVQPASVTTCAALGYSSAVTAAPVKVITKFCTKLQSDIDSFTSNVVDYYNTNSLIKMISSDVSIPDSYYGSATTSPATYDPDVIAAWAASSPNLKYTSTQLASDFTKIINKTTTFSSTMTTILPTILTTVMNSNVVWLDMVKPDSKGNKWFKLNTNKLVGSIMDAINADPINDYVKYCS